LLFLFSSSPSFSISTMKTAVVGSIAVATLSAAGHVSAVPHARSAIYDNVAETAHDLQRRQLGLTGPPPPPPASLPYSFGLSSRALSCIHTVSPVSS
jgi:hypothetical protein